MFRIFTVGSRLDRLRGKYASLMRRSYELALVNKERSDLLNEKACIILKEIRRMESKEAIPTKTF
ncbi:MAG TPA: Lacal_2735 family protein [Salinimicrobium sp.]|nr:Lacal_2735 family protein [Salinimicrobium sp.]